MAEKIVGKVEIDGSCKGCGKDVSIKVSLGSPVYINEGSFFYRRMKLYMPAYIDAEDKLCPYCGHSF